jgi:uroporphyrinogen-III synthase
MGWEVEVVPVYRTVPAVPTDDQRDDVRGADIVTFTSASTVEQWMAAFGAELIPPVVACIGPVTADTARQHGLRVDVVADVHTIAGLVDAITTHVGGPPPKAPARRGGRRRGRA